MAKLIVKSGEFAARELVLKPGVNSVGRTDANSVQVPDPSVSSRHAEIIVDGNGILVRDLGSTNGTYIGPARVTEAYLQPGHLLRLGGVDLVLHNDVPAAPQRSVGGPVAIAVAVPAPAPPPVRVTVPASAPSPPPMRVTVAAHAPPPPPVVVAPPAPVHSGGTAGQGAATDPTMLLAQPPPGKTACKFHPKSAGEWLCQKCSELFCSACVTIRQTGGAANTTCRKCGSVCLPVKVNFVAPKEKAAKTYSDTAILGRCLGFGFGAALLSAGLWTGLSWLFGFDILFLFLPMVGVICGYAVKLASQDTPGKLFSGIAVGFFILGSILGKIGMIAATHLTLYTNTVLLTGVLGLAIGLYAAWQIGGGE